MQTEDERTKASDSQAQRAATFTETLRRSEKADKWRPSYKAERPVLDIPFPRS